MRMRHARLCVYCVLFILGFVGLRCLVIIWLDLKKKTSDSRNVTWNKEFVVPNIVHFVLFEKKFLDFVTFLSILSVIKVQHPERLLIHSDSKVFVGQYWLALQSLTISNLSIELCHRQRPTHVYGQILSSVYHATDVARIQVLMEWGGIYLDSDMLVLQSLNKFRHYEMVVGWPEGQYIGTQMLIAHKDAHFLSLWLEGYKRYRPRDWYYNAGQYPTEQLLKKHSGLAHCEPLAFGVHNLLARLYGASRWPQWRQLTAVHLLSRHSPAPQHIDEHFIQNYTAPFGEIARWILYQLEPKVTTIFSQS